MKLEWNTKELEWSVTEIDGTDGLECGVNSESVTNLEKTTC